MKTIQELQNKKEELKAELKEKSDLLERMELDPVGYMDSVDFESLYDESLDDLYKDECEALPVCISGSELIKEHDPVMYRSWFNDFVDGLNVEDFQEYQDFLEEISDLEEEIEELEEALYNE